jgi:hypothetical protein
MSWTLTLSTIRIAGTLVDTLHPRHLQMLKDESGIAEEIIATRGYR